MSKHKLIKIFTPILLGLSILAHPASAFAADYRDAGILTREKGNYVYTANGVSYEVHKILRLQYKRNYLFLLLIFLHLDNQQQKQTQDVLI